MWAHPGKKLLFIGGEFAQYREWCHDRSLDWSLLEQPKHLGIQKLIRDLNHLYKSQPALHQADHLQQGFQWIDEKNASQSIFSFIRLDESKQSQIICLSNMTPIVHHQFRLGIPQADYYQLLLNTDSACYGGSGVSPESKIRVENIASHGYQHSIVLIIAPLASYYLLACSDE